MWYSEGEPREIQSLTVLKHYEMSEDSKYKNLFLIKTKKLASFSGPSVPKQIQTSTP